jgi:hypothetical protein
MLSGNAMAVTWLCQLPLTVVGLHKYRSKEAEFPAHCAQTQATRADENGLQLTPAEMMRLRSEIDAFFSR